MLNKLAHYVAVHFREEERLLEQSDYPDLEKHKEQHRSFEDWFESQKAIFEAGGGTDKLREGIQGYLKVWLMNRILFTDKSYSTYIS